MDEAEARDLLADAVAVLGTDGPEGVCEIAASQGNCRAALQDAGPPPEVAPRVDCALRVDEDGDRAGGVLLVVSGEDGAGAPYRSELLVIRTDDGVGAIAPVFWDGTTIATAGAEVTRLSGDRCPI